MTTPKNNPITKTNFRKNWQELISSLQNTSSINLSWLANIRYLLFLAFLALIYIANTHYADRSMMAINQLQKELKELRWQYMTSKSQLMYKSKQTEVAKLVESLGLQEVQQPPSKITYTKNQD